MTRPLSIHTITRVTDTRDTGTGDWRERAACADYYDPDVFFPASDGPFYDPQIQAAKALCRDCPVAAECLASALEDEGALHAPSRFGIRGGLTPTQRANLDRRGRRKAAKDGAP